MTTIDDERGQITAFAVAMVLTLLLCAGLVIDGGRILAARRQAGDVALGAARAGAQEISVEPLRETGRLNLDPARARAAAEAFLAQAERHGTVAVAGDAITVRVEVRTSMVILGVAGVSDRTVSRTEIARSVRGVSGAEP